MATPIQFTVAPLLHNLKQNGRFKGIFRPFLLSFRTIAGEAKEKKGGICSKTGQGTWRDNAVKVRTFYFVGSSNRPGKNRIITTAMPYKFRLRQMQRLRLYLEC